MPLNDTMAALSKAQLLGFILKDALKRSDLATAQSAYADMPPASAWTRYWPFGFQYRVEAALLIADAYRNSNDPGKTKRYLDEAQKTITMGQLDVALQTKEPNHLDNLLDRLAAAQEKAGDMPGADRTRAQKLPQPPKNVRAWTDLAKSGWIDLRDPDKRVAEIKLAPYAPATSPAWRSASALRCAALSDWSGRPASQSQTSRWRCRTRAHGRSLRLILTRACCELS
jgi:hypothetical protein